MNNNVQKEILDELKTQTKLLQEIYKVQFNPWKGVVQPNCCPPHDFAEFQYTGTWGGICPPPNKKCRKCLMETYF